MNKSEKELHKLYEEGIIKEDPKSLYSFIERFKPVIYKYSKYTDRMNDFQDLVQFYTERILYYHKQELKKQKYFDFTKKENEGLLVKFTKECVLQGVNLITSKKKSKQHSNDFEYYVPVDECFGVSTSQPSQENQLFEKTLIERIKEKMQKVCPKYVYNIFILLLKGISSIKDLQKETNLSKLEINIAQKIIKDMWNCKEFQYERKMYLQH